MKGTINWGKRELSLGNGEWIHQLLYDNEETLFKSPAPNFNSKAKAFVEIYCSLIEISCLYL